MRVYQFMQAKWAIAALEHRRLKISRFNELNDPFELLAADLSSPKVRRAFAVLRDQMCATRGLLCFSRDWHNPVMWSHYSDRHRGICLGFDVPDALLAHVRYDTSRLVGVAETVVDGGRKAEALVRDLLLTKYQFWEYENEVRMFAALEEVDAATGLFFSPFGSDLRLRELILGPRFDGDRTALKVLGRKVEPRLTVIHGRLAFRSFRVVADRRHKADEPRVSR